MRILIIYAHPNPRRRVEDMVSGMFKRWLAKWMLRDKSDADKPLHRGTKHLAMSDLETVRQRLLAMQEELLQADEAAKTDRAPVELDQSSVGRLSPCRRSTGWFSHWRAHIVHRGLF